MPTARGVLDPRGAAPGRCPHRSRSRRPLVAAFLGAVALGGSGCIDNSVTGGQPLGVSFELRPASVAAGDSVTAVVDATGSGMQGLIVQWGDGEADSHRLDGFVVEARWSTSHSYALPGEYTVTAIAEDQLDIRSASKSLTVN